MKRLSFLISIFIVLIISVFYSFKKQDDNFKNIFVQYVQLNTNTLFKSYDSLYLYLKNNTNPNIDSTKSLFKNLRYQYKKCEFYVEYFAPSTAAMLNMALIPDVDEYDPNQNTLEPEGLQKIEELIYSDSIINFNMLKDELKRTRGAVLRLQQISKTLEPVEYQIFESSKQELIRIWTINLTGMDASFTLNSVMESKYAMHSIHDVLTILKNTTHTRKSKQLINSTQNIILDAEKYLSSNSEFNTFNRIQFVKLYINPIYANLTLLDEQLKYSKSIIPTAIFANATTLFSIDAWNIGYFTSEKSIHTNVKQIELGKLLFFDPALSGNNKRACASCHRPEFGFTEPLAKSISFENQGQVSRNAPTLLNVLFQKAFFHDARTTYLEDQIVEVNQNKNEMHGNFNDLAIKLNGSNEYKALFKQAFEGTIDTSISKQSIIKSLAAYERSLISMNSKFDKFMRNENVDLTLNEQNGFNLFMGKAQCGTCHFAPFFNGTVPPNFDETEWEIIGTPENKNNKNLDSDKGRYNVAQMDIHQYAFKTPTIRNIEYTSPYMHNGVYHKLEEVLDFYNDGGGIGHGYEVPNQTLPSDSLKLSKSELNDIISFMKTLNDTVGLTKKPTKLPEIKLDGQVLSRKIGGEY